MSDLIVSYANLQAPAESCGQEPPVPTKQTPNPVDACSMVIPLVDEDEKNQKVRAVRFDRKEKSFVLSQQNDAQDLTWVGNHGGVAKVIDMARMIETVNKALGGKLDAETFRVLLTLTQYVVTGRIRFPSNMEFNPEITSASGTKAQMAGYLLEVFTQNPDKAVQRLLGAVTIFRGEATVTKDVSDRISWVNDILGLKPAYLKFRAHFLGDGDFDERWGKAGTEQRKELAKIISFSRQAVIQKSMKEAFRYDKSFLDAYLALPSLVTQDSLKKDGDFCARLVAAGKEAGLTAAPASPGECRSAAKYLQLGAEAALRQSLRDAILSSDGRKFLQSLVQSESDTANMSVEMIYNNGRLSVVLDAVLRNLTVKIPEGANARPTLSLDVSGMKLGLDLLIAKNLTTQREYILAAVAVLRRILDAKGKALSFSVFHEGRWTDLSFDLTNGKLSDFQDTKQSYERNLDTSFKRTERILPVAELSLCAAGLTGVALNETWDPFGSRGHSAMGYTSSGVAGAGCSALIGHYTWNKTGKVRNRYLWEGLTGLGGVIVGAGIFFLAHKLSASPGDPTKFPVDEYGP